MARIIVDKQPRIEKQGYCYTVPSEVIARSDDYVKSLLDYMAADARVPPEIRAVRENRPATDEVSFTWTWWEITL